MSSTIFSKTCKFFIVKHINNTQTCIQILFKVFHNKHERHALNKNCNAIEKKLGKTEICVGVNEIKDFQS